MIKINDTPSAPLRYVEGDRVVGQFYNSKDRLYHLAEYVPFRVPPRMYLCGEAGNFSPSREESPSRPCAVCLSALEKIFSKS